MRTKITNSVVPITPIFLALVLFCGAPLTFGQRVPHGQDKLPNKPFSPSEAAKRMTVPEGFTVEVVASEPDIVNPVAMTFDERGRAWITESVEYPRRSPGKGKDRIKILEDTNGDGKMDKVTIFAEGLNIPSGIAVGHGGVWVANAPDLLFMQDTDDDGKADKIETVLTGFGRTDTHELPNSLTWGPDGWLYGLNGVFNYSNVKYRGKEYRFTCALFRIHPRTRDFELFAEGTSNPWGVAWDFNGEAFLSACVIDHLWHLSETGYYHRQGGPYPPFTWKINSIVQHKHQKAAYCGIHFFDSDAYPEEYRGKLYMGNIHGNCINSDSIRRDGSTYFGTGNPDFVSANDAWFMPVVQKTGPDGSLYILDWYDRYHCYQDANRDPKGIDRLKGRLYRVRYKGTPRAKKFDLSKESDAQLVEHLKSPNVYFRDIAQRLLSERQSADSVPLLEKLLMEDGLERKYKMHALWSLIGMGDLNKDFHLKVLKSEDPQIAAWAVRAAGNQMTGDAEIVKAVLALVDSQNADAKLQVAVAARKMKNVDAMGTLLKVQSKAGNDKLIPHIVWQNLYPLIGQDPAAFVKKIGEPELKNSQTVSDLLPRCLDRILAIRDTKMEVVLGIVKNLSDGNESAQDAASNCLAVLSSRVSTGEIKGERLNQLKTSFESSISNLLDADSNKSRKLTANAAFLAATWKNPAALKSVQGIAKDKSVAWQSRMAAINALISADDPGLAELVKSIFADKGSDSYQFRGTLLTAMSKSKKDDVVYAIMDSFDSFEPELRPRIIELATSRVGWAKRLMRLVAESKVPSSAINANQIRKISSFKDAGLAELIEKKWGKIRTERDPNREKVIAKMRTQLRQSKGDPHKGIKIFEKVCGQCHKIYGKGAEIGPDITSNGRGSFEQLLSNVFDPSLVIGAAYQGRTVITYDGLSTNGLVVEDNDQRIVLKSEGDKISTFAREDIEETYTSKLSLMPENLETQLKPQELADLFAFLTLDRHPDDKNARLIPGTKVIKSYDESNPKEYSKIFDNVMPGFMTRRSGLDGVGYLTEYLGKPNVLRVHPIDKQKPCTIYGEFELPAGQKSKLELTVANDSRDGDFQLEVVVNGKQVLEQVISDDSTVDGWADFSIDLSKFAGKKIKVLLVNRANNWQWEYAYYAKAEIVSSKK